MNFPSVSLWKNTSVLLLLLGCSATSFAQCDKAVILTSSKTEYLNASGVLQRSVEEQCIIKVDKTEVSITPADHDPMVAKVVSIDCTWKEAFKTGKTVVQTKFREPDGQVSDTTITIEGKNGKVTCTMTQKERPDRVIKVSADKFEEQKAVTKQ
ncbi:MAG: hypothetical protein IT581_12390 [Verrucomicrobiales bacterium]|nr:hypothetical protein [Verrucomicrobiales bacterium]